MVVPTTYLAECTGNFDLIIQSNYRVEFNFCYPPPWMMKGGRAVKEGDSFAAELAKQKLGDTDSKESALAKKARKFLVDIFGSGNDDIGEISDSDDSDEDE
jgi:hypothetical protein